MKKIIHGIASLALLLWAALACAQPQQPIVPLESNFSVYLGNYVQVYEDRSAVQSLTEILVLHQQGDFKTPTNTSLQYGYKKSAFWLSAPLENKSDLPVNSNVEVRYAPLDYIDVYLINADGSVHSHNLLGDRHPYADRQIKSRIHIAPITLAPGASYQLLVRIESQSSLSISTYLSSTDRLYQSEHLTQLTIGMFYGLAIGLFFYNLFLLVIVKDIVYLHYILYVLGYTLFMASLDGLLFQLWPDSVDWENRSLYIFPWTCGIFLSQFCRTVLQTKKESPKSDLLLRGFFVLYLTGTFSIFFLDIGFIAKVSSPVIGSNAFIILAITVVRFYQGYKAALYFIIGMGSFCFGILSMASGAMNLHNNYTLAPFIFKAGAAIEMLMFSIALAQRISKLQAMNRLARIEQLKRMDKLKDDFLANTSHELRTPLNAIIGLADSMLDETPERLNAKDKRNLALISSSGYRLANLVNDILDLSKLKQKDIVLNKKPLNIEHMIDNVIELSRPLIKQKNLTLFKQLPPSLPAVSADEDRVYQILHNLIVNAIKFTAEGVITIAAKVQKNQMLISVQDTGIGIPTDKFDNIFRSFEQADGSIAREFGGTGLGLAITKQLVEFHEGHIWVTSELAKGSCFSFTLPEILPDLDPATISDAPSGRIIAHLSKKLSSICSTAYAGIDKAALDRQSYSEELTEHTTAFRPPAADARLIGQRLGGKTHRLLVVDDEPVNIEVLRNQLADVKYTLLVANSGAEALALIEKQALIEEQAFDLVLLDIMMPGMSGYEVCQRLRQQHPADQLPVIMVTAKNQVSDLIEGFRCGANDYITKPFVKGELLTCS